jgi:hypothetical protein
MEEELVTVVSRDENEAKTVCNEITDSLQKNGLEASEPVCLAKVHITEAKNVVLDFEDPELDKHRWLSDLKRATIENLGHANSRMVRGYSFRFQRRVDFDADDLLDSLGDFSSATVVQTTRVQKSISTSTNPPFSYDPAQDFVTEM